MQIVRINKNWFKCFYLYCISLMNFLFRNSSKRIVDQFKTIVIYQKGGLGDFIMLLPTIISLKKSGNNIKIDFVTTSNVMELVNRFNDLYKLFFRIRIIGSNNENIIFKIKSFCSEIFLNTIYKYDMFFHSWPPDSSMIITIALLTRSRRRIGIQQNKNYKLYDSTIYSSGEDPVIMLNATLLHYLKLPVQYLVDPVPIKEVEKINALEKLYKASKLSLGQINKKNYLLIGLYLHSAGNTKNPKHWSAKNYAILLESISKKFNNAQFLLLGSLKDKEFYDNIIINLRNTNNISILAGATTIFEDYYLVSRCNLFIGIDGGFTHLVNTLRIQSVIIWISTSENMYGYKNDCTTNISTNALNKSFRNDYRSNKKKNINCFEDISIEKVYNACIEKLKSHY